MPEYMYDAVMPWGKYEGKELGEVPTSYLKWLVDNIDFGWEDLLFDVKCELSTRGNTNA